MWSQIEMMFVPLVMSLLQLVIKNPASVAKEKEVIKQLAAVSTEADNVVNATGWTHA